MPYARRTIRKSLMATMRLAAINCVSHVAGTITVNKSFDSAQSPEAVWNEVRDKVQAEGFQPVLLAVGSYLGYHWVRFCTSETISQGTGLSYQDALAHANGGFSFSAPVVDTASFGPTLGTEVPSSEAVVMQAEVQASSEPVVQAPAQHGKRSKRGKNRQAPVSQ